MHGANARRKRGLASLSLLATVVLFACTAVCAVAAGADATGPTNLGFERGLDSWTRTPVPPAPGAPVAVGVEGAAQYPIYAQMGILSVSPWSGQKMLRLGAPKGTDSNQVKGVEQVAQSFTSDGRDIAVVYRLFTWEHRSDDKFVIKVTAVDGGSTPFSFEAPIDIAKPSKYWDSGWREVRVTGIPVGQLKLSYALSNAKNAAHDTWVYVDRSNLPPAAGTVAITPPAPTTKQIITAVPSGFRDDDADPLTYHYSWYVNGVLRPLETSPSLDLSVDGNGDRGDTVTVDVYATDGDGGASATVTADATVANSPPVADFTWAPGGPGGVPPHEGDAIGLYSDPSHDPDGDDIVRWDWRIDMAGQTPEVYGQASPVGFIVPYDQGDHTVTLTVWDAGGLSSTSVAKTITVQDFAPRVNALSVEVLPGGTARLVGRFLDQGWMDAHSAGWAPVSGEAGADDTRLDEDNYAAISSGYVEGSVAGAAAPGNARWTLDVHDDVGESGNDTFDVTTVAPDPSRFEDEDAFPTFHAMDGDGAYLSYIQSEGDIDIFEVKTPDGHLLPQGTEVLATLRDLPADYDLAVFEGVTGTSGQDVVQSAPFMHSPFLAAPFMHSPFMHSPFMHSAYEDSPFMHSPFMHSAYADAPIMQAPFMHSPFMHSAYEGSPFMHSPFMHSPFMHSPFMHSPFMHSPFMHSPPPAGPNGLDGYPLAAMSFTGTANDNTSGIDISFNELGFDNEAIASLRVLGFSANTGTDDEVVLATAGYPQTPAVQGHVYVAVKGTPGNFSTGAPYTLQLETSRPLDLLAAGQDEQPPLVTSPSTATTVVPTGLTDPPLTLFVTQLQRLSSLYPAGATQGDPRDGGEIVKQALVDVAGRPDVRGVIISLPGDRYADWDKEPWKVELANDLAGSLRSEIKAQLAMHPSIRYVVLVGNDRVVPFRRLADRTVIGNEQSYADQSFLMPPSATLSSVADGYVLTDDFYADEASIAWNGGYLYIPDLAVSRLVEKPAEIARAIQAFEDADGVLGSDAGTTTAVVSGHGFMADGAAAVQDTLAGAGVTVLTDSLIGEGWHGDQLWDALDLGPDLNSLNAHFTHFAGLSAFGYEESVAGQRFDQSELLLSGDVGSAVAAGGGDLFEDKLVISMGCHSGLNAPDEQSVPAYPGDPVVPGLDLPQAMMRQGGVYVGSTGYGYGDTVGVAGTEALVGVFADRLVSPGSTAGSVGLALAEAKQSYLGSLSTLTPYEQKSSVEFTMYGMPQYRFSAGGEGAAAPAVADPAAPSATAMAGSESLPPFLLRLSERSTQTAWSSPAVDRSYEMALHQTPNGDYVTADGQYEANPERPIHPRVAIALPDRTAEGPAHGFVYKMGTYADLSPDGTFGPAISRYTNEWEIGAAEFQVVTGGHWPAEPAVLTTRETPVGYDQSFVAVPAQFKATSTEPEVVGHERVWSYLEAEVLRSPDPSTGPADWTPPSVLGYDLWMAGGKITVSVDARDLGGVSRIVVLQMSSTGMFTPVGGDHDFGRPGIPNGPGGRYEVTFDPGDVDLSATSFMIQVADGAGNVTTLTGKGDAIYLPTGLRNAGFEEGLRYWVVDQPTEDNATVVGQDPIASIPGLVVGPFSKTLMLRQGVPRDGNAHQVKGVTSVSQQFVSDGRDIVAAYRIVTFDRRVEDVFVVDVKDSSGASVGRWSDATGTQSGPLPYKVTVVRPDDVAYLDTGWTEVIVGGLPAGRAVTLSYTLDNDKDAAHDTWIYVDQGD